MILADLGGNDSVCVLSDLLCQTPFQGGPGAASAVPGCGEDWGLCLWGIQSCSSPAIREFLHMHFQPLE